MHKEIAHEIEPDLDEDTAEAVGRYMSTRRTVSDHFRIGSRVTGEAEGMAYQDKVSGGRDRQKLRESFDDPQYDCERWAPFIHACTKVRM